ncbi:hypothetical protein [Paenibacillus solani]|uniref:Uncharacterized protein n=1 Tax=Paenibacillus solani TaxID=1705565 RepID=A0A0M1P406_9BACL|nr:hypothetical protein [Paenibacillus solani]KOR89226.1 hypothetical protein AM231_08695 [Paenibacillus solani]
MAVTLQVKQALSGISFCIDFGESWDGDALLMLYSLVGQSAVERSRLPLVKGGDAMIALVELVDVLKGFAAALSILLSVRKLLRWIRRKLNKRKPTE